MLKRSTQLATRKGQALILVVLLMMAALLVGSLFVAVVTFNQEQSARMSDKAKAVALAEAALRYADYMLTYSAEGADWRPPSRPYDPQTYDPDDPGTWPNPPVYFGLPSAPPDAWTASPNMFGPDGIAFTDDDYYLEEERDRGWTPLIAPAPGASPPHGALTYVRTGFSRFPDPDGQTAITAIRGALGASVAGELQDQLDISQGHILMRVTYDPSPPYDLKDLSQVGSVGGLSLDPLSKYIKIEAIGVVYETSFVWHRLTAYKAIGLSDHLLWVTDKNLTGRPVRLGFGPWFDLNASGTLENRSGQPAHRRGDFLVTTLEGPLRFNSRLEIQGDNADLTPPAGSIKDESLGSTQVRLIREPLDYDDPHAWFPRHGGYLRDDRLEAAAGIAETSESLDADGARIPAQSATADLVSAGSTDPGTVWSTDDTRFSTRGGAVLDGQPGVDAAGNSRSVDPLRAPSLFVRDPATGMQRYHVLTRDSGRVVLKPSTGETLNIGRFGHGRGVYVDNFADVQFVEDDGTRNIELLIEDFLGNLRPTHPRIGDSGWNATRTMYAPPGVEITLFASEEAALEYGALAPVTDASPGQIRAGEVWWPNHVAGEPGIRLLRKDQRWRIGDPNNPDSLGDDSGTNVMYLDYPPPGNQVIFAEGNVRIQGQLPRDPSGTGRYNLTVVSGGTIYVDGQILSPQDLEGRYTAAKGTGCPDEENTYIALLARDCVVVNPTQIVPHLTQGLVTAASDDPANPLSLEQHWELSPNQDGVIYSRWFFGAPPQTGGMENLISLVAYHAGEDPGPAGIGLRLYNADPDVRVTMDYDFDPVIGNPVQRAYLFVPPGILPGPARTWIAEALTPFWALSEDLAQAPPRPLYPWAQPWPLNGPKEPPQPPVPPGGSSYRYISTTPGVMNSLALRYQDPGPRLAELYLTYGLDPSTIGGATDWWLRRLKIEERDPFTGRPKGALQAKVNALMYAQEGCFFIIPGQYFDPHAARWTDETNRVRFMRYNYDLEIRGAIAENFHAGPAAWQAWQERWAYPQYFDDGSGPLLAWGTIRYHYDETLLASRVQPATVLSGTTRYADTVAADLGANLPKLPLLPTCPGLIYRGTGS